MEKFEHFGGILEEFWRNLEKFGEFWRNLRDFEEFWRNLRNFGDIWRLGEISKKCIVNLHKIEICIVNLHNGIMQILFCI